jgi:hypothetical protein
MRHSSWSWKREVRPLSDAVIQTLFQFHENDEYNRLGPGKKGFVSANEQLEEAIHREHVHRDLYCVIFKNYVWNIMISIQLCKIWGFHGDFLQTSNCLNCSFKFTEMLLKHWIFASARGTIQLISFQNISVNNGILNRKWSMCFNTLCKILRVWCGMQVTIYGVQFWISRWKNIRTVGDVRLLNINVSCCPLWRIYWLYDRLFGQSFVLTLL